MNAKETYHQMLSKLRRDSSRIWLIENGYGTQLETKAVTTYRTIKAISPMTFKTFLDCLEAAQNGLAYSTRNHWFFIVNGDELQFTKEECARFARYFSEGFHMNLDKYTKIIKAGGCYINERLFEDDEVFPLKAKVIGYDRFVIGCKSASSRATWVMRHEVTAAKIKADAIADEFYAQYETEQSDLNAEMEAQRYG